MSILSSVTGIGINPFGKRKIKINPMRALGTVATLGSMGALGPVAAGLNAIPGGAALLSAGSKVKGVLSAGKGAMALGIGKRLLGGGGGSPPGGGGIMDFLGRYGGDIGVGALSAFEAANAARASKRQGQLSDEALNIAKQRWRSGAGLRSAGTAGLMKPIDPATYADPTNPFAAQPRKLAAPIPQRLLPAGA